MSADRRQAFLWSGLTLLLAIPLFWPTLRWMAQRFNAPDSFYSHGWLIPLASAWLVWQRRDRVTSLPRQGTLGGLGLLLPCLLIYLVATWLHIGFVSGLAMVGMAWALVWMWWGRPILWALRFPLLYLLFMVPVPSVWLIGVSFSMKLLAASLATRALAFMGFSAVQAGSTIHLPTVSVVVDDTCSGLRSLISLIALATLWTSLMGRSAARWQRGLVVLSSIPIALIANMVRILVLVLASAIYGPKVATGVLHYGSGVVVFGVSLLVLGWLSRFLQRWSQPSLGLN